MTEADLRLLDDDGGMTVVSITDTRTVQGGSDGLADRVIDAIEDEFAGDDSVVIER